MRFLSGLLTSEELRLFTEKVASSNLPGATVFRDVQVASWDAALRFLASALPDSGSVVVIDELPYLTRSDPARRDTGRLTRYDACARFYAELAAGGG
jgi:uncharacterized protein